MWDGTNEVSVVAYVALPCIYILTMPLISIRPHKQIKLVIVLLVAQIRGGRAFFKYCLL